jgi:DTW domain-containing protein YfiP
METKTPNPPNASSEAELPSSGSRRCAACLMLHRLCICALTPRVESLTRLVLIIHRREILKPTNTGALAVRSLVNSEMHVRGTEGLPLDYSVIAPSDAHNLYLFPADDAVPLSPELGATLRATGRPVRLIVPDGNWGQAARVGKKVRGQPSITKVSLPPGPPSSYGLRREAKPRPDGLATLEAISRAFAALEGEHVSEPLLEIFRIMVARSLWSRGSLPAAQVYGGMPP